MSRKITAIEKFAKEQLGIKLTEGQVNYIRGFAENRHVQFARRAGITTANTVIREYLKAGLK